MKKLITLVALIVGSFTLSGCDMFDTGVNDMWYDEGNAELHISYNIVKPKEDEDTGVTPIENLFLVAKHEDGEWFDIEQLPSFKEDDYIIPFKTEDFGNYELRLEKRDEAGTTIYETESFYVYVNEPQFIYHFDVHFDSWNGVVYFNFGINDQIVKHVTVSKSTDGGTNWQEVLTEEVVLEDGFFKNNLEYYEFEENNYVYKLSTYDQEMNLLDEVNSWSEINVWYDDMQFEGDPKIEYVDCNYDVYSRNVNIWWNAYGAFDEVLIERSLDNETFEEVGRVPRFVHSFNYEEANDGEYYYRVSALVEETSVHSYTRENTLRVNQNALIGYLDAWLQWDTGEINVNWDFMSEEVETVTIERRKDDGEYEFLESFGSLKKAYTDKPSEPGTYTYKISLLDLDETVLDSLETKKVIIEQQQHVHHINAWFNQSQGEVQFHFGFNQNHVDYYIIEKSADGGLTWVELINNPVEFENDWYKDNITVYELEEGVYAYRILGYNDLDEFVGEAYNYNEVIVDYTNLNLNEPTELFWFDGEFNIYDNSVNLWWHSQGDYQEHVIEYSLDGVTFTEIERLPRVVTFTQVENLEDGVYTFRISAVDTEGTVKDSYLMEKEISVRENAQIGKIHVWYDCTYEQVQVNFEIIQDNVDLIALYRTNTETNTTTLLGEFGPLKRAFLDEITEVGMYTYKVVLLDIDGNIIDELDSHEVEFYLCNE